MTARQRSTEQRDIVVIGASAGGVEALTALVGDLPRELPAAVFVVLHVMASGTSLLPSILERTGDLAATTPVSGERFERGHIYVAPPDHHMVIVGDLVHLTRGPRENGHRPAVDPLFRSAARSHGQRVIGVILSGAMDDGTAGLRTVKERGGVAVVQDPEDALHPSMPMNAIEYVDPDHVVPVAQLAALLCGLLDESLPAEPAPPVAAAPQPPATAAGGDPPDTAGPATGLTCPECGGALWERDEEGIVRFACRVGHAFAPDSLADEQARALEAALWGAMRSLEERADLLRRISRRRGAGESTSRRFEERARSAERHVSELRATLSRLSPVTVPVPDADALAQRERRDESGP